ncbi:MAG: tetratricopeptide repeat protein, partial [Micropruina sp.]|nr:tetratricopeptide repeat protein [Micropruina sp.]
DLGRAIPLYEQTLTDRQRILGSDHPNTLTSRNNLASALWQRGQQREAFILWEAAAESAVRLFGPRHEVTRTLVANLTEAHRFLDGT